MRFPPLLPHPRRVPLQDQLARHPEWLSPWSGRFFRFQTLSYPSARDILSGTGAKLRYIFPYRRKSVCRERV